MPKIAATPPEVPLTTEEEEETKLKDRYSYQTIPPKIYKSKDAALWPQIAILVFRQVGLVVVHPRSPPLGTPESTGGVSSSDHV